ncbi:hypothetical protein [Nocardia sp. NPDC005825]|uniref:hypothetical protein n=1 Tax=unclassified Nocardia TaxID=2637762 RepID=UPI0033EEBC47
MQFDVVVPVLAFQSSDGRLDMTGTEQYAARAAASWVDHFIVSGSTARGDLLTPGERASLLDLWLNAVDPTRVLACCWDPTDIIAAVNRNVTPMVVLRTLDPQKTLKLLAELPSGSTIYSHPMFDATVFDAVLAGQARADGTLPAGGKLAKISLDNIRQIRSAAGDSFRLWDGSSRHIDASVSAGAAGIVATPLTTFMDELPAKEPAAVQTIVDQVQARLDALPDRATRTAYLMKQAITVA